MISIGFGGTPKFDQATLSCLSRRCMFLVLFWSASAVDGVRMPGFFLRVERRRFLPNFLPCSCFLAVQQLDRFQPLACGVRWQRMGSPRGRQKSQSPATVSGCVRFLNPVRGTSATPWSRQRSKSVGEMKHGVLAAVCFKPCVAFSCQYQTDRGCRPCPSHLANR